MSTQIVDLRVFPLERSLERVFGGGTYTVSSRYTLVTEVHLGQGVVGQTYGGDEERYQKQIAAIINGPFRELLIGRDVFDLERNWEAMFKCSSLGLVNRGIHTLDLANKAILMQAIAAVDIACWDAIGKSLGKPLYKLLGGYRDRLPVIAIGGYYDEHSSEQDFAEELLRYKCMALAGIKMKVGRLSPSDDAERVRFARQTVGDDFVIVCDANQAWTVPQAIEFARRVKELGIRWLEEPVQWYDQLRGLREVRRSTGIPVAAGQGEISCFGCRDLMLAEAVDILNVDVTIAGGITEWRRIAAMANAFAIEMAHHEEPQVSVHLLASIPHGLYVEIFPDPARDPLWSELPAVAPQIQDGFMHVPQGPGLGIPLKQEVIERYRAGVLV
jgi:L-alanine-DL-glutamate epimerase-like enolase superfamily enzyme